MSNEKDLDLHGVRHHEAEEIIENHVLLNKPPFNIITGNSAQMKKITSSVLDKHNYKYAISAYNMGCIIVLA